MRQQKKESLKNLLLTKLQSAEQLIEKEKTSRIKHFEEKQEQFQNKLENCYKVIEDYQSLQEQKQQQKQKIIEEVYQKKEDLIKNIQQELQSKNQFRQKLFTIQQQSETKQEEEKKLRLKLQIEEKERKISLNREKHIESERLRLQQELEEKEEKYQRYVRSLNLKQKIQQEKQKNLNFQIEKVQQKKFEKLLLIKQKMAIYELKLKENLENQQQINKIQAFKHEKLIQKFHQDNEKLERLENEEINFLQKKYLIYNLSKLRAETEKQKIAKSINQNKADIFHKILKTSHQPDMNSFLDAKSLSPIKSSRQLQSSKTPFANQTSDIMKISKELKESVKESHQDIEQSYTNKNKFKGLSFDNAPQVEPKNTGQN